MTAASAQQIRAIHTLKAQAALDEESYRDFLEQKAGVRSSKELTVSSAITVIDNLKVLAGQKKPEKKAAGALNLSGPYAGICRALWISGYELGVFEDRTDTALTSFVRRQTKLDSLNWVRDWEDARKVIEALKGWIAREANMKWPGRKATPSQIKQAVVFAQQRLLGEPQLVVQGDVEETMRRNGARVRALKGAR